MKHFIHLFFILAFLPIAQAEPAKAVITSDGGTVEYALPNSTDFKKLEFKGKLDLPEGSTIRTGKEGVAGISPFPGAILTLAPNSEINLSAISGAFDADKNAKRQADIKLSEGTLRAVLNRKADGGSPIDFKIKTSYCVAAARGTKYVVVNIGGKTYIKVKDGTVTGTGANGNSVDLTNNSGVGVCGPDGKITIVPLDQLPPEVQQALDAGETIDNPGDHSYLNDGNFTPPAQGGGGGTQPPPSTPPPVRVYYPPTEG